MKGDWYIHPKTNKEVTFIDFARSEGRFAKHFDKDGNPSETLIRAAQDRLENWWTLQELAGLRTEFPEIEKAMEVVRNPGAAKPA